MNFNKIEKTFLWEMPLKMAIVDMDGNILFISKEIEEVFGKEIINKKCWEVYKNDRKQCEGCPLRAKIRPNEVKVIEPVCITGGAVMQIIHKGILHKGKPVVVEIFHDITKETKKDKKTKELKLSHKNLSQKVSELEAFNKVAVGRELKMVELKKRIEELENLLIQNK